MKIHLFSAPTLRPLRLCGYLFLILPATATQPAKPASSSSNQKSKINNPQSSISSSTYTTSPYGLGTRTTDTRTGQSWTTTRYGNGTRTTNPDGSSYTTTRYGNGTRTTGKWPGLPVPAPPKR